MVKIQNYIPVTRAKNRLHDIIRQIQHSDDTVAITQNGVPAALLSSMSRYEELLETLEIFSNENAMKSLRRSLKDAREGRWGDFEEVFPE